MWNSECGQTLYCTRFICMASTWSQAQTKSLIKAKLERLTNQISLTSRPCQAVIVISQEFVRKSVDQLGHSVVPVYTIKATKAKQKTILFNFKSDEATVKRYDKHWTSGQTGVVAQLKNRGKSCTRLSSTSPPRGKRTTLTAWVTCASPSASALVIISVCQANKFELSLCTRFERYHAGGLWPFSSGDLACLCWSTIGKFLGSRDVCEPMLDIGSLNLPPLIQWLNATVIPNIPYTVH